MSFDYRKLRGKITEVFGGQRAFAEAMGRSSTSISAKLNNRVQWTQTEILKACKLLCIPEQEMTLYFFTPIV